MTILPDPPDDSLPEKQVSSQPIYTGRVFRLESDVVQLPDGQRMVRDIVRHPGAVAIVPIDHDGKIVMVRQYRYAAGRTLLEIPAGTLEPGEDPDECAVRELQEETGYRPGQMRKIGGIYVAPSYDTEFIHLYLATDLSEAKLEGDNDEFIEVVRLTWDEALAQIRSGAIADGKTISGVLLAREVLSGAS